MLPLPPMEAPEEAPPAAPPITRMSILPSTTINTPNALGAEFGTVFVAVGFQERTRYNGDRPFRDRADGVVALGLGLGNARERAALNVAVKSFSTVRSGLFNAVGVDVKAHRYVAETVAIAVGWENVPLPGTSGDGGNSVFGVATGMFELKADVDDPFSLLTVSAGVGNGRFRRESDVLADRERINVFGSAAILIVRPVAAVADWTGQDLVLGASVAPFRTRAVVITAGFADVLGTAGDGARFVLGVGAGHRFVSGPIQF